MLPSLESILSARRLEPRVQVALDLMLSGYGNDLTLADIARSSHVSPRHLSRLFRCQLGASPLVVLRCIRMYAAKQLLVQTSVPIKLVAARVGLPDVSHFTHDFAGCFGVTPGRWRSLSRASATSDIQ